MRIQPNINYNMGSSDLTSFKGFYTTVKRGNNHSGDIVEFLLKKEKEKSNDLTQAMRRGLKNLKSNIQKMKDSVEDYMDRSEKDRFA